ncbi:putative xyloglucan 6-xylosyltransferase 1 [Zea mays]|uniref:Putative xyloglucan 6-xylosyltransferase 1 n=1 Tax=Zea mays TaxID=4577 RepID=A0A3L6EFK5_MAIZE|nr:putative xyloglucan 6-xylosyltransferase 1 [Zea mays]
MCSLAAIRGMSHPHRALAEHHDARSRASTTTTSSLSSSARRDDDPDPPPRSLRDPPYTLGPKIFDWDEQRAAWHRRHPETPPFLNDIKPRVLLVTGSSPKPCENPVGDHYLLKSIKNKMDYCRVHGIEAKLSLMRALLLAHPEVEFLWWMDSDAMFTDMAFELPWERYGPYSLIMHGWDEMVYDDKNWIGLNTGSFLLRNCQWSLDMLDTWAPMGPKGPVRIEAGKVLTKSLKDRPVFEADDQSAMVYILATQRKKWGDKGILVDRYEEMLENYKPGLGDHRWPLVTHFLGRKPCGKFGDYPVKRCLKNMDRAFNFGDNQILQMYGFTHKSLASRRVKRIWNETSNPLETKDELGLLHPAFKAVKTST